MSARIAHLVPDSPFLRFTAEVFHAAEPGANTFVVVTSTGDLRRDRLPADIAAETIVVGREGLERANAVIRDSDIAVFHSVGGFAASAISAAPPTVLKVWSGWGGDYYGTDWSPLAGLLDPLTADYRRGQGTLPGKALQAYRYRRAAAPLHAAARATDVFSAPVPDDLAVFRRRFPGFRGRYAQLNYASVEDTYAVSSRGGTGHDILVGNSASLPNNHLDVLEALARAGTAGRRIVTPLSYGDAGYAEMVTTRGRALFGDAFVPLRQFLPLDEYQALIADCSTVVMGHRRQQAVGNVAAALWTGAQVVLHDRSPLFTFLRDRGAHVAPLSSIAATGVPYERASTQQLADNRRVLNEFWSRERVLANIRELVSSA